MWDAPGMKHYSRPIGLPERRAFKVSESAEILGISEKSVRRLIDRGVLRPCRELRHVLIPAAEIDRFLAVRLDESQQKELTA